MARLPHDDSLVLLGSARSSSVRCAGRERARACVRRVPGGSLSAVLEQFGGSFEAPLIRRYLLHLLRGLEYLHSHMIVHRDIKGENVLVSEDGIAKLGERPDDFLVFILHFAGLCIRLEKTTELFGLAAHESVCCACSGLWGVQAAGPGRHRVREPPLAEGHALLHGAGADAAGECRAQE